MGYFKKSISTFGTQIVTMLLGIFASILAARILGPELNGQATIITSAISLMFMVGNLGMGSAFSFFTANKKYPAEDILSLSLISGVIQSGLIVIPFLITYKLHQNYWIGLPNNIMFVSLILVPLYLIHGNLARILMGANEIYKMNLCGLVNSSIYISSLAFFLPGLHLAVYGIIFAQIISRSAALLLGLVYVLKIISFRMSFNIQLFKGCLAYGIKSYFLILINFLNYRADLFIIKYFRTDIEVGYYSLAVSIAEMLWLIPNSTISSLFPLIASSDKKEKSLTTFITCRWSILILLLASICIFFLGKMFIVLLYGEAYLPSFGPLVFLLPGIVLFPIYKLLIVDLAARGYPGYGTITSLVAFIINVILNILIIPRYGIIGASISTSVSYVVMSCFSLFFFKKNTEAKYRDIFLITRKEISYIISQGRSLVKKAKSEIRWRL